ncbi:hypothetical protein AB0E10_14440 [Streptomyces sp. NPDC048045]|uniref:hypothetical protein n=1 Tax=Streptomyces sp. NPDC048045 TaxID=3154710 RepID=UPI003414780C
MSSPRDADHTLVVSAAARATALASRFPVSFPGLASRPGFLPRRRAGVSMAAGPYGAASQPDTRLASPTSTRAVGSLGSIGSVGSVSQGEETVQPSEPEQSFSSASVALTPRPAQRGDSAMSCRTAFGPATST